VEVFLTLLPEAEIHIIKIRYLTWLLIPPLTQNPPIHIRHLKSTLHPHFTHTSNLQDLIGRKTHHKICPRYQINSMQNRRTIRLQQCRRVQNRPAYLSQSRVAIQRMVRRLKQYPKRILRKANLALRHLVVVDKKRKRYRLRG